MRRLFWVSDRNRPLHVGVRGRLDKKLPSRRSTISVRWVTFSLLRIFASASVIWQGFLFAGRGFLFARLPLCNTETQRDLQTVAGPFLFAAPSSSQRFAGQILFAAPTSSHAKVTVFEKIGIETRGIETKQPNLVIRKCARVQLIKNGKKIAAFIPNDACLNFIKENDGVLIAGFGLWT